VDNNIARETHRFNIENLWDFRGRSYRWEFMATFLIYILALMLNSLLLGDDGTAVIPRVLFIVLLIVSSYVMLVSCIRRLHDIDLPGKWALLILIPGGNIFLFIYLSLRPGSKEENEWGI
jgi:uncharacterized membrane protein YhaH (DUF805 family)